MGSCNAAACTEMAGRLKASSGRQGTWHMEQGYKGTCHMEQGVIV